MLLSDPHFYLLKVSGRRYSHSGAEINDRLAKDFIFNNYAKDFSIRPYAPVHNYNFYLTNLGLKFPWPKCKNKTPDAMHQAFLIYLLYF